MSDRDRQSTLRTLGSLELRMQDGKATRTVIVQGKRMALLSYLALARPRGFHRRDTLCGLFWPEVDQGHSRAALRQALHSLRQSLGKDAVLNRGPDEVGLEFSLVDCDALRFEEAFEGGNLEEAAGIYGGPLLHGFYLSDAPEFEKWLGVERDRYSQMYADILRSLAIRSTEREDYADAARWWKQLANHAPYSPDVALQVMSALDAGGERAAAIEHARIYEEAVRADLEMQPDMGVKEYAARLKAEPSYRPVPPVAPRVSKQHDSAAANEPHPVSPAVPETRFRMLKLPVGISLVALIVFVGYLVFPNDADVEVAEQLSLGVMTFENLGSADEDYFVNGLAEELARRLAGVQILRVSGPMDVAAARAGSSSGGVAAQRSTRYSLRIAVERTPGPEARRSIRVSASLVDNSKGTQLWAESLDGDPAGLFDLQSRLAEAVPRALGIPVLSSERDWLRASPTGDLRAYDQYLRASEHLRDGAGDAPRLMRAVELLRGALALDSGFVHAHAKLSIAHTLIFSAGFDRSAARLVEAKSAADRALYLRADSPVSHLAQAWYYYRGSPDYDRALRHFEIARANYWGGMGDIRLFIGDIRRRRGDLEEALEHYRSALESNPACAECAREAAMTHLMLSEFEAAKREAMRAINLAPTVPAPRYIGAVAEISSGGNIEETGPLLPDSESISADDLVNFAAGRWASLYRIIEGDLEGMLGRLRLDSTVTDTAGYYLAKADLVARGIVTGDAIAYYDSARAKLEPIVRDLPGDALPRGRLGLAYAGLGRLEDALAKALESSRLLPLTSDLVDGAVVSEMVARIYMMVGDADGAIDRLELILAASTALSGRVVGRDPVWSPLRARPRFRNMIN